MSVEIQLEWTPNPSTLKYVVNRPLLPRGSLNLTSRAEADEKSPLGAKLFAIEGVEAVMLGRDFVTVTKGDVGEWDEVNDHVIATLESHLEAGLPVVDPAALEKEGIKAAGAEGLILDVLENEIRPAVMMDGGDITLDRYEEGVVYVHMKGSCSGCPSSTATLKMGIETRLKEVVPEVVEVVAI